MKAFTTTVWQYDIALCCIVTDTNHPFMTDPCAPLLPLNKDSHQYTAFNLLSAESNITYINQTHKIYMQMQQLCESNRKSKLPSPPIPCVKCIGKPMKNSWRISEYFWKVRKAPKRSFGKSWKWKGWKLSGDFGRSNLSENSRRFWKILEHLERGKPWKI